MSYDVLATFNAIDNISNISQNIGGSIASMAQAGIGKLDDMGLGFEALGPAAGIAEAGVGLLIAAVAEGVNGMEDMNRALAGVAARTGQSASGMGQFRAATEALFNTGLVDKFDEAARIIEGATTKIKGLTATSPDLAQFATNVAGVAKAWGVSGDKVINSVQGIMNKFKDLAGDPIKALDLLAETAEKSHLPLQAIDQIITQYGGKFEAAGLSAQGMGELIADAANNGVTKMMPLATAIDNFHQRIVNPPRGFNAALKQMGLSDVARDLRTNKISMESALDSVFTKFSQMPDGPAKAKAAIDLFGKGIDKIGGPETLAKLAGFTDAFGKIDGAATTVANTMQDDGTLGTAIHRFGNNVKTFLEDKMQAAYDAVKKIDWKGVGDGIGMFFDNAKKTFIDWFGGGGKIVTFVKDAFNALPGIIDNAKTIIGVAFTNVISSATTTWANWFGAGGKIETFVRNALGKVKTFVDGARSGISDAFTSITDSVSATWNDWFGPSGKIVTFVTGAIQGVIDGVKGFVSGVSQAFGAIARAAEAALQPILSLINQILSGIAAIAGAVGGGSLGTPQPAAPGGVGVQFKAGGGDLGEGWTIVGEEGPELINKHGGLATVFSNSRSRAVLGAGANGGGGGTTIHISVGHLVGTNGMTELSRILYKKDQSEQKRRGLRD